MRPADADELQRLFTRCSPRTRYHRFHGPLRALPEPYLTEALHAEPTLHDALVAQVGEALVALGSARRLAGTDEPRVEIGLLVEDAWQGRGLGTLLLRVLATRAGRRGIVVVECNVLTENRALLDVVRRILGPPTVRYDGVTAHAQVRLRSERRTDG